MRSHAHFEAIVASSADPNMLLELLRQTPCHVGALMQLRDAAATTGQVWAPPLPTA